ncbi:MAG: hypothetical protein HY741_01180 [Chloroflexi bacterium]|nr:hypothetical protein [Chloroflexota bacterium]
MPTVKETTTPETLWRDFDRSALTFLDMLNQVRVQLPTLDRTRAEKVRVEVEHLRLEALVAEFKTEFPDLEPDEELLQLVGVNPERAVEEDKIRLTFVSSFGYTRRFTCHKVR